ncbi:MAG: hypothetical protein A2V67_07815 [Deltaproteobacteria bacterium RBG_13_61_14]|nr:MAG: hypothetical protein A2V67_07815 [Deltaproteobacteria bacterium RBG_13_61_14]
MNRGEGKFYVIAAILIVAVTVTGVVMLGPVYQRKWKFGKQMEEDLRAFDATGEERMYEDMIREARAIRLPPLTVDDFYFEGGEVGQPALLQCEYIENIKLPGGRIYPMRILIEINIAKLPTRPF